MHNERNDPHHHQNQKSEAVSTTETALTPEAALIALANSKGQELTTHTLWTIEEPLELQGVSLEEFVDYAWPHFQNGITNPSGFLISRAQLPHRVPPSGPAIGIPCPSIETIG